MFSQCSQNACFPFFILYESYSSLYTIVPYLLLNNLIIKTMCILMSKKSLYAPLCSLFCHLKKY